MKKLLFIALSLIVSFSNAQISFEKDLTCKVSEAISQPSIQFTQNIQMTEEGSSILQTNNGGYISLGTKGYSLSSGKDAQMIKTDQYGNILWEKLFGGSGNDLGKSILQTNDGGYIFTGGTTSFGAGGSDVQLIKTDSMGVELWSKTYGGAGDEEGEFVQENFNGGYIIIGKTSSYGAGGTDIYVINTDSVGNVIWSETFGGVNNEKGNSIQKTSDEGYLLVGTTFSFGAGNADIFVIKINKSGVELWNKTYGGSESDWANSAITTSQGNFVIVGGTNSYGAGDNDAYVINLDLGGNEIWTKTFGAANSDIAYSITQTNDGGYIITGESNSFGTGKSDLYIVKADSLGVNTWSKAFGGAGDDAGTGIEQTTDGGYIITGCTQNYQLGNYSERYLIKLNQLGNTLCNTNYVNTINTDLLSEISLNFTNSLNIELPVVQPHLFAKLNSLDSLNVNTFCSKDSLHHEVMEVNFIPDSTQIGSDQIYVVKQQITGSVLSDGLSFNVYPNPSDGTDIRISMKVEKVEEVLIVVYDMLGKEYYSKVILINQGDENVFGIDPSGKLSPGIYMITATAKKEIFSKRIIVK